MAFIGPASKRSGAVQGPTLLGEQLKAGVSCGHGLFSMAFICFYMLLMVFWSFFRCSSSKVDVTGWCASHHLSLFAILQGTPGTARNGCTVFGSGFDPSSDCFDAVLFFSVLSMLGRGVLSTWFRVGMWVMIEAQGVDGDGMA